MLRQAINTIKATAAGLTRVNNVKAEPHKSKLNAQQNFPKISHHQCFLQIFSFNHNNYHLSVFLFIQLFIHWLATQT